MRMKESSQSVDTRMSKVLSAEKMDIFIGRRSEEKTLSFEYSHEKKKKNQNEVLATVTPNKGPPF